MTANDFVREWDLLYATYGEVKNYNSYLNWRSHILGEAAISDPLGSAASDYEHGFMSYYAYLRLYGWIVAGDPNSQVADKYGSGIPPGKYLLTTTVTPVAKGNGVSLNPPGGVYDPGTAVQVTAVPAQGYAFSSWSGDASGTANPVTAIIMDKNKTVVANFKATAAGGIDLGQIIPVFVLMMLFGVLMPMAGIFQEGT